jgi:hypothetical protein
VIDRTDMRIPASIVIPAILLASLLLAGCYTVLIHPSVRSDEEYARGSIFWQDNCLRCHAPGEVEYFYSEVDRDGHRALGRFDTPWVYGPYSSFNYPWWFDSDWIPNRHLHDFDQSRKEKEERQSGHGRAADQTRSGSTRGDGALPTGGSGTVTRDTRTVTPSGGSGTDKARANSSDSDKATSGTDTQTRSRDTSSGSNQSDSGRSSNSTSGSSNSSSGSSSTPTRSGSTRGK